MMTNQCFWKTVKLFLNGKGQPWSTDYYLKKMTKISKISKHLLSKEINVWNLGKK